jgi:hypothetical protein
MGLLGGSCSVLGHLQEQQQTDAACGQARMAAAAGAPMTAGGCRLSTPCSPLPEAQQRPQQHQHSMHQAKLSTAAAGRSHGAL